MASSANASKTLYIGMEKKCAELEHQLAVRNSEVDSANDRLRAAEENLAAVMAEKDKQSSDLMSFQRANEDLKRQARDLDHRLKESESSRRAAERELEQYLCAEYKKKVVDEYKSSPEFEDEFFAKSNAYYNRGCLHVLRNVYSLVQDKALLKKIFMGDYTNPDLRGSCDIIPFDENELREITAADSQAGRNWSPPELIRPSFEEQCDELRLLEDEDDDDEDAVAASSEVRPEGDVLVTAEVPVEASVQAEVEIGPQPVLEGVAPVAQEPASIDGGAPAEEAPSVSEAPPLVIE